MKVVEFVSLMLEAHGKALVNLCELFGDEVLIELLEKAGENHAIVKLDPSVFEAPKSGAPSLSNASAYAEIESSVHELKLKPFLEFHLWAYPYYRAFVEGPVDLTSSLREKATPSLMEEAITYAGTWLTKLEIPDGLEQPAMNASEAAWFRFRVKVLERLGNRPVTPIR